jgi:peptide chain release factor 2
MSKHTGRREAVGNTTRARTLDAPAILEVRAGSGGRESLDFAQMLLRMYCRWAMRHEVHAEEVEVTEGKGGGVRSATIRFERGLGVLVEESGVHRLQRVSPYGRGERHTSFCEVVVLPEVDEQMVEIQERDVRMDFLRGSGPGGQHRNKTSTGVRMVHVPTGVVATCLNGRSQWQNRQSAMTVLRSRVAALPMGTVVEGRWEGQWGHQIRTYTLAPTRLAKDHRSGKQTGSVDRVLDGDLSLLQA